MTPINLISKILLALCFISLCACTHLQSNSALGDLETQRIQCFERSHNEKQSIIKSLPIVIRRLIGTTQIIREYSQAGPHNLVEDLKTKEFKIDDLGPWEDATLKTQIVRSPQYLDDVQQKPTPVMILKTSLNSKERHFYFPLFKLKNHKDESIGNDNGVELKIKQLDQYHLLIKLTDHQSEQNNFAALIRAYDKKSYELNDRLFDYDPIYDFEYSDQECEDLN